MPRVTFLDKQNPYDDLLVLLRGNAKVQGKSDDDLAEIIGHQRDTVLKRFKHPEDMKLGELLTMCKGLNIPIEKLRQNIKY